LKIFVFVKKINLHNGLKNLSLAKELISIQILFHLKTKIMNPQRNTQHQEGEVTKQIENQTAKLPSDIFLWAALGSMAVSAVLQCTNARHRSLFVGQWAAPFLLLGIYNKLVKLEGHDQTDK
jgi:hypothetical protein